jgi:hypothetical protein
MADVMRGDDVSRPSIVREDYDYFQLDQTLIINNDKYRFLGADTKNNYADIEQQLRLDQVLSSAIISTHTDGMEVRMFVLTPELARDLSK